MILLLYNKIMGKSKYTHNTKSLRRYKVKELRDFIKTEKLPIKRTSKLTKTEIVSALLRLQRNGHCECMTKLKIKDKKKLSPLQEQALLKGQNRMKEKRLKMKTNVENKQKIDKKPIQVPISQDIIKKIKEEIIKEEKPTKLQLVKSEGTGSVVFDDVLNLDKLFEQAEQMDKEDLKFFEDLLEKGKGVGGEKFEEEKKEEINDEQVKKQISTLGVIEIREILRKFNISLKGRSKKSDLVDIVFDKLYKNVNILEKELGRDIDIFEIMEDIKIRTKGK